MTSFHQQRAHKPDGVLFKDVAGEAVLLNLDTETYFGLDEVGTRMWVVLTTSPTIQDAYDTLLDEYDVEPDILRTDMTRLIEELVENGLLDIRAP